MSKRKAEKLRSKTGVALGKTEPVELGEDAWRGPFDYPLEAAQATSLARSAGPALVADGHDTIFLLLPDEYARK
ncbi:UNVERIFIED_ORG: hypothetical protein J2W19_004834 [Shinella zoogloeoides]|nr:hypothetical protein [Shinella zoogloeoides]